MMQAVVRGGFTAETVGVTNEFRLCRSAIKRNRPLAENDVGQAGNAAGRRNLVRLGPATSRRANPKEGNCGVGSPTTNRIFPSRCAMAWSASSPTSIKDMPLTDGVSSDVHN